jgi:hypothetical protein
MSDAPTFGRDAELLVGRMTPEQRVKSHAAPAGTPGLAR